jgi:hypothetical protein
VSALTREQIEAMTPGRKLDVLVARRVMGWKTWPAHAHQGNSLWLGSPANYPHVTSHSDGLLFWSEPDADGLPWNPSEMIDPAWAVVEKFTADRWRFNLEVFIGGTTASLYRRTENHYADRPDFYDWAETPALAICRCALKAVES